ncbi:hypothetical protein ARMSODRAFT_1017298 [Armillaria solidipes]|uniref:Uncharacterized protein n=1 Tax=Armillaria solidipes TaxID=1076256 RepID=A0A2H3C5J5_9AGAR|nr:hypothetical protein ARMSODRAFT_1017298 [Armillaria solidipes]
MKADSFKHIDYDLILNMDASTLEASRDLLQLLVSEEAVENLQRGFLKYQSLAGFALEIVKRKMNRSIGAKTAKFKLTTSGEVRIATSSSTTLPEERDMNNMSFRDTFIIYANMLETDLDMDDGKQGQLMNRMRKSLLDHLCWCLYYVDAEGKHQVIVRYSKQIHHEAWQHGHHNYDYSQ